MELTGGADEPSLEGRKKFYVIGRARYKNFQVRKNNTLDLLNVLPVSFENFLQTLITHNGPLTDENYTELSENFKFEETSDDPKENFETGLYFVWSHAVLNYILPGYNGLSSDDHNLQLKEGGEFCYDIKLSKLMKKKVTDHTEDPTKEQLLYAIKFFLLQMYERVPMLTEKLFDITFDDTESKQDHLDKLLGLIISDAQIVSFREINKENSIKLVRAPVDGGQGPIDSETESETESESDKTVQESDKTESESDESDAKTESGSDSGSDSGSESDAKTDSDTGSESESDVSTIAEDTQHKIEFESPLFGGKKINELIRRVKGQKQVNSFGRKEELENLTWYKKKGSIIGLNTEPMYIRAHKFSRNMPELIQEIKNKYKKEKVPVWFPPKKLGKADGYFKNNEIDYEKIEPWILNFDIDGSEIKEDDYDVEPIGGTIKKKINKLIYKNLKKKKYSTGLLESEGLRGGLLIYI